MEGWAQVSVEVPQAIVKMMQREFLKGEVMNWKFLLVGIIICLIVGFIGCYLLLDHLNRKRHGGFLVR